MKTLKVLFSLALVCGILSVPGCSGDDTTPADTTTETTEDTAAPAEGSGDKPAEGSGDKPAEG